MIHTKSIIMAAAADPAPLRMQSIPAIEQYVHAGMDTYPCGL